MHTMLIGHVADRNLETGQVKVQFPGLGGLVSWWLPVMFRSTFFDQLIWMPDLDEHVVCLVDELAEEGVVLGAIYSATTPPPVTAPDKAHVTFKDGTVIEYDRAAHKLLVHLVAEDADVEVTTTGNVTINVPDGKSVFLGSGAGAKQLVTKDFVTEVYVSHEHPSPTGLTGPPILLGTEALYPHVTERAVGR